MRTILLFTLSNVFIALTGVITLRSPDEGTA